jgi:hypothetical protein
VFSQKKRFAMRAVMKSIDRARFEDLNLIKLASALLCANCELIVNESVNGGCPACGSRAMLSVSKALGGTLEGSQDGHPLPQVQTAYSAGWEN